MLAVMKLLTASNLDHKLMINPGMHAEWHRMHLSSCRSFFPLNVFWAELRSRGGREVCKVNVQCSLTWLLVKAGRRYRPRQLPLS